MTNEAGIGLGAELVDRLFPFLLAIDPELRIVKVGRGVRKLCADAEPGVGLLDIFTIHRPEIAPSFEALRASDRSTFLLAFKATGIRLRGEMAFEARSGLVLFLGSPWFTDIATLHASGLTLDDFTIHDPVADFLAVVKQRDELQHANNELERANAAKTQ